MTNKPSPGDLVWSPQARELEIAVGTPGAGQDLCGLIPHRTNWGLFNDPQGHESGLVLSEYNTEQELRVLPARSSALSNCQ